MASETEVEKLITESWRLLSSLVMNGEAKLSNGRMLKPSPPALIRTIENVAKLKPPKRRLIARVEDFRVAETTSREE
jgi:hypothetical protein